MKVAEAEEEGGGQQVDLRGGFAVVGAAPTLVAYRSRLVISSVTRSGDFAPFGRFFSLAYLLLGDFWANFLFTCGDFLSTLMYYWALFCQKLGAFSVKTAGHTVRDRLRNLERRNSGFSGLSTIRHFF